MQSRTLPLYLIYPSDHGRAMQPEKVGIIAESMERLGLCTPITVRPVIKVSDGRDIDAYEIVAGRHRYEAALRLKWKEIECFVANADEMQARLWEIAENLHRAELTVQERADHIEEWRRLTAEKVRKLSAPSGGPQPSEKGYRKTATELGLDEKEVRNAAKIASIAPEAKEAARAAGLSDNQSALLKVAAVPQNKQVSEVARLAASAKKRHKEPAFSASERRIKAAQDAYLKLSAEERNAFMEWLEENEPAVFDATAAGRVA